MGRPFGAHGPDAAPRRRGEPGRRTRPRTGTGDTPAVGQGFGAPRRRPHCSHDRAASGRSGDCAVRRVEPLTGRNQRLRDAAHRHPPNPGRIPAPGSRQDTRLDNSVTMSDKVGFRPWSGFRRLPRESRRRLRAGAERPGAKNAAREPCWSHCHPNSCSSRPRRSAPESLPLFPCETCVRPRIIFCTRHFPRRSHPQRHAPWPSGSLLIFYSRSQKCSCSASPSLQRSSRC